MDLSLITDRKILKDVSRTAARIIHGSLKNDPRLICFESSEKALNITVKNTVCFAQIEQHIPENAEGKGCFSISLEELRQLSKQKQELFFFRSEDKENTINVYMPNDDILIQRNIEKRLPESPVSIPDNLKWQRMDSNIFPELLLQAGEYADEYSEAVKNPKQSICLDGENNKVVATDGRMLYMADTEFRNIKKKAVMPLTKFLKTGKLVRQTPVEVAYTRKKIGRNNYQQHGYLRFGNIIYSTEAFSSYPDYGKAIPQEKGLSWEISETAQQTLIENIKNLPVAPQNNPAKLCFSKGKLRVEGDEKAFFVMEDRSIRFSLELKVNARAFANIISMKFDMIHFYDSQKPIVFDDPETGRKALLMPLRD